MCWSRRLNYLHASREALSVIPTQQQLVSPQQLYRYLVEWQGLLDSGRKFRTGSANSFIIENGIPTELSSEVYTLDPGLKTSTNINH
ncbi:MAG: hypothetical protein L3J24_02985 [Xanthomonadales bacterium]|nr:hypothetical protein [Xanthomonadales bacterium]